jgi:hypothetical protein
METTSSIKHLKLVTGEELICELVSELQDSFIVKNALSLMAKTMNDGTKYFAFKTYMVYQDTPTNVIMVFTDKIMSIAVPTQEMVTQYSNALSEMAAYLEEDEAQQLEDDFKESLSLDEFLDEMDIRLSNGDIDSDISGMTIN